MVDLYIPVFRLYVHQPVAHAPPDQERPPPGGAHRFGQTNDLCRNLRHTTAWLSGGRPDPSGMRQSTNSSTHMADCPNAWRPLIEEAARLFVKRDAEAPRRGKAAEHLRPFNPRQLGRGVPQLDPEGPRGRMDGEGGAVFHDRDD